MSRASLEPPPSVGERLKSGLGPMRPLLRRSRRAVSRGWPRWSRSRYLGPFRRRIHPLNASEIEVLVARDPYYKGRGPYLNVAGGVAADLIDRGRLRSGLELGPNLRPLLYGADVIDVRHWPGLEAEGRVIIHDARVAPWPIRDRAYDLFVALQVFEHLEGAQPIAFREVARVARSAIISLPIDWNVDDTTDAHHGLTNDRALAWFAPWTPTRVVEGNPGPRKRLIYVFEDLRTP